jgi:hypothetical protein
VRALPAPRRRLDRKLIALTTVIAAVVSGGVAVLAREVAANTLHDIELTKAMIIGTWRGSSGAVLTLKPDGKFTASALPVRAGESSYGSVPTLGVGIGMSALLQANRRE